MDTLNFDFEPFGEQLVQSYQENHLEDSVNPQAARTVDEIVANWNQAEAPPSASVLERATYEVQRRADLGNQLRTGLSSVASAGFANYATREVDLVIQDATLKLAFRDHLTAFLFAAPEQPTERAKRLLEGPEGESEGFRTAVATAYHHFCHDFQLDEAFRGSTKKIVDVYQKSLMQMDFHHLLARWRDVGHRALEEAGYEE